MSRVLLLSLLAPGVAGAASPTWFAAGVDSVEIAGRTESVLYTGTDGRAFAIGAFGEGEEIHERPVYIGLSGPNTVPADLVDALGLKAKGADEAVTIPVLKLGDAVLRDVRAKVGDEVVLNAGTLDGLAVGVSRSTGKLVLAPASEADAVLAIGTPATATVEGKKAWWFHGSRHDGDALSWQIGGEVLGASGVFRVSADATSTLGGEVPGADLRRGGENHAWAPATAAGLTLPATLFHQDQSLVGRNGDLLGVLGADALHGVDWAVDPASKRFAAAAVTPAPVDPSEALVAIARADFARAEAEAAEEEEEGKDEKSSDPDAPDAGDVEEAPEEDAPAVARHTDLAEALWTWGDRAEALEHYAIAAGAAGERCGPHLTLGRRLLEDGRPDDALMPLQVAAAAWDRWYVQDQKVREDVVEGHKVGDDVFAIEQASSCFEAWGELAAARFAQDSYDEVRAIARAHREMDPLPWQIAGVAGLVEGDPKAANADLRQALQIGARQDGWTLVALAWANHGLSRPEAVAEQLHALATLPDVDFVATWSAATLAIEAFGPAATAESATALTKARPDSAPAFLALAVAQKAAGQDASAAIAEAKKLAEVDAARRPGDDAPIAWKAVAKALSGDSAGAQADLAGIIGPESPDAWLAQGLVAEFAGGSSVEAFTALVLRFPTAPIPVDWADPAVGDAP